MALRYRNATDLGQRRDAVAEVTQWARDILWVDDDTVVKVARPRRGDPDYFEAVTTILMRPEKPTSMINVAKSIEVVTGPTSARR